MAETKQAPPQFLALKGDYNGKYVRYIDEGELRGNLILSADQVVSPMTKFKLEPAKCDDKLVHIKCCYNNKYWVTFSRRLKFILPVANDPEEDRSKWSCTLFEFVHDDDLQAYRIRHVRLGLYLLPNFFTEDLKDCLIPQYDTPHRSHFDLFTTTDYRTLLELPKQVAFKGDNGRYLRAMMIENHEYLEFSGDDIGDERAGHEIVMNSDGSIRIKSKFFGKFWRLSPNWIWADATDAESSNAWFWAFKYPEGNTIALKNLGNDLFCKRLTTEGKIDCLNAAVPKMGSSETKLIVEELILKREISDIRFRLEESKIYHQIIETKDYVNIENKGAEDAHEELTLGFKDTVTGTFSTTLGMKIGISTTIETKVIPVILEGKVDISTEFSGSYTWGQAKSFEREVKNVLKFTIPHKKKKQARLTATKGLCDVPFSYTQIDTLLDGRVVPNKFHDGMYSGGNYYSFVGIVEEI